MKLDCGCEIYQYRDTLQPSHSMKWCDVHNKAFRALAELPKEKADAFNQGVEFAIITIGNAITSEEGKDVPFLAYSEAVKALRNSKQKPYQK